MTFRLNACPIHNQYLSSFCLLLVFGFISSCWWIFPWTRMMIINTSLTVQKNRQFSTQLLQYKRSCSSSWFRRERNNRRRITAILAPLQTLWYISIQVWDVIGRSVVVSTDKDDLGQGNHPRSLVSIWGTKYQIEWIFQFLNRAALKKIISTESTSFNYLSLFIKSGLWSLVIAVLNIKQQK